MSTAIFIGQQALVLCLVAGLALSIGWLTRFAYVVTLPMLIVGVVSGALLGFFTLLSPPARPLRDKLSLLLCIVVAACSFQVMDDIHHVSNFRKNVALTIYADSRASDPIDEDELEFFGRGADDILARNMKRTVGFTGPMARWLHRADGGIRTFGSWEQRRVVPVGRYGVIVFMLFEIALAFWMGIRVMRRIRHVADRELAEAELGGEGEELQDKSEDEESAAG